MVVFWILLRDLGRDLVHLGQSSRQQYTRSEAGYSEKVVTSAILFALPVGALCRPEVGWLRGRKVELARKHADDRGGIAVQHHRLAEHVSAPSVSMLPFCIADERDKGRSGLVVVRPEITAENGSYAQGTKKPAVTWAP